MPRGRKEMYQLFCKENGEHVITYNVFVELICKFNKNVTQLLLEGKVFNMKHNMSTLSVVRNKRDPANLKVNWKTTLELKAELLAEGKKLYDHETGEGHKYFVYYTSEYYLRFRWVKEQCKVSNKFVYRFDAARGAKGNSPVERLTAIINKDDLAYLDYKPLMSSKNGNL